MSELKFTGLDWSWNWDGPRFVVWDDGQSIVDTKAPGGPIDDQIWWIADDIDPATLDKVAEIYNRPKMTALLDAMIDMMWDPDADDQIVENVGHDLNGWIYEQVLEAAGYKWPDPK